MTALRDAAARLAERARTLAEHTRSLVTGAPVPPVEMGAALASAMDAVRAVEDALRPPADTAARCGERLVDYDATGRTEYACGLPLPCAVHNARHACRHGQPLDGNCNQCGAEARESVRQHERGQEALRVIAERAGLTLGDCRHSAHAGSPASVGSVCWRCYYAARAAVRAPLVAALREMLARYEADAGEPETAEARAVVDRARALTEPCVVCQEDEGDAPRVVRWRAVPAGRAYCSDECARSALCHCCAGTGWEVGPTRQRDGVPCGLCRLDDRADYERQRDDDARDHADEMAVDTMRDQEIEP